MTTIKECYAAGEGRAVSEVVQCGEWWDSEKRAFKPVYTYLCEQLTAEGWGLVPEDR